MISDDEFQSLKERVDKLAIEKSYFQLSINMINELSSMPGLENAIKNLLNIIVGNIGGTNVSIYYFVEDDIYYADVLDKKTQINIIDDFIVKKALEATSFVEIPHDFSDTKMLTNEFTKAYTCAIPLIVREETIGILKMENIHISLGEIREHFQPFFKYAALLLKNEISDYTNLKKAYEDLKDKSDKLAREIVQRQKTEESLLLTQFAVNLALDSIFWITPDARFFNINESTCRQLGYTREELLEMTVFDVDPEFPRDIWEKHWQEIKDRKHFTIETKHKTKSGDVIPVEVAVNYVEYEGLEYNVAFARDISERKKAEAELRRINEELEKRVAESTIELRNANKQLQSELAERVKDEIKLRNSHERLLAVLNSLDAIVYVSDMQTYELLYINENVKNLFGDAVGKTCWKSIQEGQTGPCDFCTNKYLIDSNGNPTGVYQWELQNTRNNRWYDIRDRAIRWVDGRIVRLEIATDITERIEAEGRVAKLAVIVESSDDAIIGKDINGIITSWNKGAEKTYGFASSEAVGQSISLIVPPDRREELQTIMDRIRRGEHLDHFETKRKNKAGNIIDVFITISPIHDQKGEIIGASTIARDITDRKRAEEQLRIYHEQLEELVKKRTAELEAKNAELERMNKLFVGRELRMAELKKRIEELEKGHEL